MKRQLVETPTFLRGLKRLAKTQPAALPKVRLTLNRLSLDASDPRLRTYKLQGRLDGRWSCSVAFDLRVIFDFAQVDDAEVIVLLNIGTHDEVY